MLQKRFNSSEWYVGGFAATLQAGGTGCDSSVSRFTATHKGCDNRVARTIHLQVLWWTPWDQALWMACR